MKILFSSKMHDILGFAAEEALRTGWKTAGVDHLMLGLLRDRHNNACKALLDSGIDLDDMKLRIDELVFRDEPAALGEADSVHPTKAAAETIKMSAYQALRFGSSTIRSAHLLLAIILSRTTVSSTYLRQHGIAYDGLQEHMEKQGMLHDFTEHASVVITEEIVGAIGEQLTNLISSSGLAS